MVQASIVCTADSADLFRKVRHELSASASLIEAGIRNISGQNPDIPKALRVHSMGMQKLREAMCELDQLEIQITSNKDD